MKKSFIGLSWIIITLAITASPGAEAAQRTFTFTRVDKVSPGMLNRGSGSKYMVFIGGEASISGDYSEASKYVGLFIESFVDNALGKLAVDNCAKSAHLVRLNPSLNRLEVIAQSTSGLPPREPRPILGGHVDESYYLNNIQRAGSYFYVNLDMFKVAPPSAGFPELSVNPAQWTGADCGVVTPPR